MFRTDLLSIMSGLNTVFTADDFIIPVAVNTVLRLLMMDSKSIRKM